MRSSSEILPGAEPQKLMYLHFLPVRVKTSRLGLINFLQHLGLSFWVGIRRHPSGLRGVSEASVSMWVPCWN